MRNQNLSDSDKAVLEKLVAEAEKQTKAQIVLATVKRSDNYAEIPWKAFAFGTSVAGFVVFLFDWLKQEWAGDVMILFSVVAILSAGLLTVLLTLLFPSFARLFPSENQMEAEVLQRAESLFLSKELFATESRGGILLLVSLFERQVVILPDKGVRDRLSREVMNKIISKMTGELRRNEIKIALETGLGELVALLIPDGQEGEVNNELSNKIIEEEGK